MSVVVKVQIPLFPKPAPGVSVVALVYDQERRHVTRQVLSAADLTRLAGRPRVFFQATLEGPTWVLGDEVPDPNWSA